MKEKIVDQLLRYFIKEDERFENLEIPSNNPEKRNLLLGIINLRAPYPIPEEILVLEDQLLQLELKEKEVMDVSEIETRDGVFAIWQGDITALKIDAIVNPGNSALLGCFLPGHSCLDNQIHTRAGIRLRLACNEIMQGREESIGKAEITDAYNLPCDYVIHTVGPKITGKVTNKDEELLSKCYKSCLDIAKEKISKLSLFQLSQLESFVFLKN